MAVRLRNDDTSSYPPSSTAATAALAGAREATVCLLEVTITKLRRYYAVEDLIELNILLRGPVYCRLPADATWTLR